MPLYKVMRNYEQWFDVHIEAKTSQEAENKYLAGDYTDTPRLVGGQFIEGSIVVEEIEE